MDTTQLFTGFIFGSIGMGYIVYGRKQINWILEIPDSAYNNLTHDWWDTPLCPLWDSTMATMGFHSHYGVGPSQVVENMMESPQNGCF